MKVQSKEYVGNYREFESILELLEIYVLGLEECGSGLSGQEGLLL